MFGNHFYYQRIRKSVATFGALFNNLSIIRKNSAGGVISTVRVPLAYAPREKYLDRIKENPDLQADTMTAIKLPRMSFEIVNFQYDSTRMVAKTNKPFAITDENGLSRKVFYSGVPYNIFFQLNIYARSHDDALQVVEQIVPYFSPQYNLTVKPFDDYPEIKEDVPLTLQTTSFSDDFESVLEQRRTIIYSLEFEMKTMFYGPIGTSNIIREVQTNFYLMGDSDTPVSEFVISPDPVNVSPDSDFGFNIIKTDHIG